MPRLHVATLAEQRHSHIQQAGVVGAMCGVATLAILADRGVFKEQWTTFVLMALVTLLVYLIG